MEIIRGFPFILKASEDGFSGLKTALKYPK
jgi:hypothetical protein